METIELLEELSKKSQQEIEIALTALMVKGKIDFLTINKSYIEYLEHTRKIQKDALHKTSTSLMEQI